MRGDKSINIGPQGTDVAFRYQSTSSEPRPNCVLRVVTCITGRLGKNNVRVLELNVSPKFALMEHVVLNVNSTQSTMSASSSNINNCFGIANLFT